MDESSILFSDDSAMTVVFKQLSYPVSCSSRFISQLAKTGSNELQRTTLGIICSAEVVSMRFMLPILSSNKSSCAPARLHKLFS